MPAEADRRGDTLLDDIAQRLNKLERFERSMMTRYPHMRVQDFVAHGEPVPVDGAIAVDYTGTPDDLGTASHTPKYGFGGRWHAMGTGDLPYATGKWSADTPAGQSPVPITDFETTDPGAFVLSGTGGSDYYIDVQPGLYAWTMGAYARGVANDMRVSLGVGGAINGVDSGSQEFTTNHLYTYDNSFTAGASGYLSPINPATFTLGWGVFGDTTGVDVGGTFYIVKFSSIGYFDIE